MSSLNQNYNMLSEEISNSNITNINYYLRIDQK